MNSDYKLRGMAGKEQFRWFAVKSSETAQKARDLHDLSPISTLLMSRMLSAAAMLAWDLKHPNSELTLQIEGDGPLAGALVIASAAGNLKGYVKQPQLFLSSAEDNFAVGKALGKGTLRLIRNEPGKQAYTGTTQLVSGEIAEDIAFYFQQSEQVPTAVNLGILIDQTAKVRSAGGFIIQQMPFADPKLADIINDNLAGTPNISDLMDMGYCLEDILSRFVFKGLDWQTRDSQQISYTCNCSRERFSRALLLLGENELASMREGIKPVCHFCNREYHFSPADIESLIMELQTRASKKEAK